MRFFAFEGRIKMTLVSDSAIKGYQEDLLERKDFAYNIADIVAKRTENDAFTIGLMGAWGSGKSSVLNLIEERFQKCHRDMITIFFNPWRYSGEEELLMFFFNEIATALDSKLETNGDLVRNFFRTHTEKVGTLISAASGDPSNTGQKVASWLSSFLKTSDLVDFKERVQKLLKEKNKKVVIYIDDIDRLPNENIQELFKVIKLMGDFNYVTYILSFDRDVVTQALAQTYSYQKSSTFLEKIIQLQIEIPLINKKILIKLWQESIERVLNKNEIKLTEKEWLDLDKLITDGFLHNLDDIRKIKNIENSLSYIVPIIKKKIYIVDLLVVESLKFFYPDLYSALKYKKVNIFNKTYDLSSRIIYFNDDQAKKNFYKEIEDDFYNKTKIKEINNYVLVIKMLKELIPSIKIFLTGSDNVLEQRDFKTKLRVGCEEYFDRYFSYNLNPQELPEFVIEKIIREKDEFEIFKAEIKEILSKYDHFQVISKFFIYMDILEKNDKVIMLKYLLKIYYLIDENYNENGFFPIKNNIRLLGCIVDYIKSYDLMGDFFIDCGFLDELGDDLFVNFYYRFTEYNEFYENKEILDKFSKKALLKINHGMNVIDFPNDFIISQVLKLLKLQNGFNSEIYLNEIINSKEDLEVFLTAFCTISHPGGREIKFDKSILEFIDTFYPIDKITYKINQFCPNTQSKSYEDLHLDNGVIEKYLISLKEIELEN